MQLDAAVIKEQGQTFAVVVVKPHVLQSIEKDNTSREFSRYFPGMPIVLMAQNSGGRPTYYGRKDIVAFLSNISISRLPWKTFTFN